MQKDLFKNSLQERCYIFGITVIRLCDTLPNKRSSWVIQDQLIRSATSIGANIIEAQASSSRLEFKKFYEIALKSANESKYWLYMLKDVSLAEEKQVELLFNEVMQISNMIGSAVLKLKGRKL